MTGANSSFGRIADPYGVFVCLTPRGITAVGTLLSRPLRVLGQLVLNALRHHCGRHGLISGAQPALTRAQRLAASLRSAPVPPVEATWTRRRAQRLAASLRSALGLAERLAGVLPVLNALRHHCGRHEQIPDDRSCGFEVLNALRHHCGRHRTQAARKKDRERAQRLAASLRSALGTGSGCSTGSGVLNALRHHCGRHTYMLGDEARVNACSTPCGITAVGTQHDGVITADHLQCSTPCGITAVGTRQPCLIGAQERPRGRVLNALRHHCGRHPLTNPASNIGL